MLSKLLAFAGIVLSLLFSQLSQAQFSGFSLNKAIQLLNMHRIAVFDSMKKQGFIYGGEDGGFDVFTKRESVGEARLVLSFTNNRLRIISWTESLIYARYMLNDIDNSDFVLVERNQFIWQYKDEKKGLLLYLFDHSKQGYMTINIIKSIIKEIPTQKPTSKESKNNKPKAVFSRQPR